MVQWLRTWGFPTAMGLMALGIVVNFTLLIPLISRVSTASSEGQEARARQQAVFPVSLKVYEDAFDRGVITLRELACFRSSAECPVR